MNILLTGATSFTGMHFIEALYEKGHTITVACRRHKELYTGLYQQRLNRLHSKVHIVYNAPQGSDAFLRTITQVKPDIFGLHGAYTTNYRSSTFDLSKAYQSDTNNLLTVLNTLRHAGCQHIVYTGSIFAGHGLVQSGIPFSSYGLNKRLVGDTVHFYGKKYDMDVSTFVIPNPFGEMDNQKMLHIFGNMWRNGEIPTLTVANYIRDNIHVELLSQCYAYWLDTIMNTPSHSAYFRPSGYAFSMLEFTKMFAMEIHNRLGWACHFEHRNAEPNQEPTQLVNTDLATDYVTQWNPSKSWDALARDISNRRLI